jgi:uncharacterized membrane protein YeaQ/YmgE (transglycosylase-associated protein family)
MAIIGFVVFGLVVGVIAKLIMPGRDPGGIVVTAIIGMVGSVLGGLIGRYVLGRGENYAAGWIMSVIGTLLLLFLYRQFAKRAD